MGSEPQEIYTLGDELDTKSSETQDTSFVPSTLDQDITSILLPVCKTDNGPHILQYTNLITERIMGITAQNIHKKFKPFLQ